MRNEMTKAQVLAALRAEQIQWEALLTEVGEARMTEEILASWWSIKDVIAHVMWYEQQTADALQPDPPQHPGREWLWELPADKRNAILFTEARDRPLAEIRADADRVFAQLVATVEALSEEEVQDPHSFPNMPPGWQVWHFIGRHSYEHYREHMPRIQAWLDLLGPEVEKLAERAVATGTPAAKPAPAQVPGRELVASIT